MQEENGMLKMIQGLSDEEKRGLELNEMEVPLVKIGDVFKIRDCRFEVSEIKPDGIFAKGITRKDFFEKRDKMSGTIRGC